MKKIVNYYLIYKHSPERYCRTIKCINPLEQDKFYHTFIKVQLHLTYIKNATFFIKIK